MSILFLLGKLKKKTIFSLQESEAPEEALPAHVTGPGDRRLRKVLKAVERRVRELQRGASDIPLSQKLAFFVARAASEAEEEPEAPKGPARRPGKEGGPVRGFCQPLVITTTSEPTPL